MNAIKIEIRLIILGLLATLLTACSVVPLTGRKQLNMVSDQEILSASQSQYRAFIAKAPISKNRQQSRRIYNIGSRIARAAEWYMKNAGMANEIANYRWEFNLIASPQANAFCMPGGKIAVFEGILKYAHNDDELATVMAHEVSHAMAKHANERMSQAMLKQYGGAILGQALGGQSAIMRDAAAVVYGLGSEVLIMLPYSRRHEYEADAIGLNLMAIAGYNPQKAVDFWQHMAAGKQQGQSDFMSTHPSDHKRIEAIKKELPSAMKYYRKASTLPTQAREKKKQRTYKGIQTHY